MGRKFALWLLAQSYPHPRISKPDHSLRRPTTAVSERARLSKTDVIAKIVEDRQPNIGGVESWGAVGLHLGARRLRDRTVVFYRQARGSDVQPQRFGLGAHE